MLELIRKRKALLDIILSISATAIPLMILQLFIYPNIANQIGAEKYGFMITVYSIWIMISNSLGNVLNNIKLLKRKKYEKIENEGDVKVILNRWLIINAVVLLLLLFIYSKNPNILKIILSVIIGTLILLKAYLEVGFRIKLDYFGILKSNAILTIGFIIGFYIFKKTGYWEAIYFSGYFLTVLFLSKKTKLLNEPASKTKLFSETKKDANNLVGSSIIAQLANYADKLVIFPLMGGATVSVYYTATILAKVIGMLTGPINSVVLSYISRWEDSKNNIFYKVLLLGIVIVSVGYFMTLLLYRPIIGKLFPQWLNKVMEIIPITTVTVMLGLLVSILNPFVLRFCNISWQFKINIISTSIYFICSLVLWKFFGFIGFCVGTAIGNFTKLLLMLYAYKINTSTVLKKENIKIFKE